MASFVKIVMLLVATALSFGLLAAGVPVESGIVVPSLSPTSSALASTFGLMPTATTESIIAPAVFDIDEQIDLVDDVALLPLPTDYCSTAVYHHNLHRLNHSAPLVTYSQDLAVYASTYIKTCELDPKEVGNWFITYGTGNATDRNEASVLVDAIGSWYDTESITYAEATKNYSTQPNFDNFGAWGHFSQMVWHEEIEIGCWSAVCGNDTAIVQATPYNYAWQVVCTSRPVGNINPAENYVDNVTPPLGHALSDYSIMSNNPC